MLYITTVTNCLLVKLNILLKGAVFAFDVVFQGSI